MLLKFRVNLRGNRNGNFNGVWREGGGRKVKKVENFVENRFISSSLFPYILQIFFFIPFFNLKETQTNRTCVPRGR